MGKLMENLPQTKYKPNDKLELMEWSGSNSEQKKTLAEINRQIMPTNPGISLMKYFIGAFCVWVLDLWKTRSAEVAAGPVFPLVKLERSSSWRDERIFCRWRRETGGFSDRETFTDFSRNLCGVKRAYICHPIDDDFRFLTRLVRIWNIFPLCVLPCTNLTNKFKFLINVYLETWIPAK